MLAPDLKLANGVTMPALGLGTYPMDDREAEATIATAIQGGYRLIDTAEAYRNEQGVGLGIRASGIDREEVFVTTKVGGDWHGYDEVQQAFAARAQQLGLDYIDLLMIHWPLPMKDRFVETWGGMIRLLEEDKIRAIGVSNFKPHHIDRLLEATGLAPHVNQIQLNPRINREEERRYHTGHGIMTESWAPIGRGGDLLAEPPVAGAARAHDRTHAQIVLRWHVQIGAVPIPKTSNPQRLHENLDVFDFSLSEDEVQAISALDHGEEDALDSDTFGH